MRFCGREILKKYDDMLEKIRANVLNGFIELAEPLIFKEIISKSDSREEI